MSQRPNSLRAAVSVFVVLTLSITALAKWTDYIPFSESITSAFSAPEQSEATAPIFQPRVVLTPGMCDGFGVIEVEASAGTVGPTGYGSLKSAFDAINLGTHQGNITIDVCGDIVEAPVVGGPSMSLNASGSGGANYATVGIAPAGGAPRMIQGAATAGFALIEFNGADNVIVNGLNTGGNALTISNTTASASSGTSTFRFVGGATGNAITNSTILGSFSAAVGTNGGNFFFSTDAVTLNGNDSNLISNNNIGPAGANLPTKGVYCNGSTGTTAIGNSGITIDNNNFFDIFGAAVASSAVYVASGCNGDSITNNRFYQTGTRTWTTGAAHNAINIQNTSATSGAQGFTITGNTIGYASNTQTGTYTLTGSTGVFRAIVFNGITGGTISNINNNTIASASLTGVTTSGTGTSGPFMGIFVNNGSANTNNNTIGSQVSTGSLTFSTNTTTATDVVALYNFSSDNWTSNSNNIGGLTANNAGATGAFIVYGMRANTSSLLTWTATSNLVGGTIANSIQNNSTSTTAQLVGIALRDASSPITTLTQNTLRNLTAAGGTGTTTSASVIGILSNITGNHTISQNSVLNLSNSNATAASVVTGIQFTGGTVNIVERNIIHSLTASTNSVTAEVNGIRVGGGTTVYRNNFIALGAGIANAIGAAPTNAGTTGVNGINGASGTDSFFHNSVYVGGAPTAGLGASYAFNSTVTTNTRSFRDNIFFNARSNSGATGKNFAIKINGTTANPAGLTLNNNVYFSNGSGGVFGFFNSLDVANLAAWKAAVGQDGLSFESNPQFIDPTNSIPNLHIHPTNPTIVEGNGADVGVTNDYDGETRASFTPVDIGADAGNFVTAGDVIVPVITFTNLANTTSTMDRTLSISVTDTGSGVPTAGVGLPVLYFRKNGTGSYNASQCVFVSGSNYNCTVTYASVGGVVGTDTINYYIAAQDAAGTPNVTTSPSGGAGGFSANPPAASTPPTTPPSYLIAAAIGGTKTVCPAGGGCDYTTLTGAGGVFAAINAAVVTNNVEIQITGDLTTGEDGTVALNAINEEPVGSNFAIEINPVGGARLITGSNSGGLIRLNAADRVIIDGSVGGGGTDRSLTITQTNTGTSSAVIWLQSNGTDGAQNNVIKFVNIVGQANTSTLYGIGMGSSTVSSSSLGTNNNSNTIRNNSVSKTQIGIYSQGASAAAKNTGNTITANSLNTISPNNIGVGGIRVGFEEGITISRNMVANMFSTSTPTYGITLGTLPSNSFTVFTGNEVTGANVTANAIDNIVRNGDGTAFGIGVATVTSVGANPNTISNNFISGVRTTAATPSDFPAGILLGGGATSSTKVYFNSISMNATASGTAVCSSTSPCFGIVVGGTNPVVDIRNNIFSNRAVSTTGKTYAIGFTYAAPFTNLTMTKNVFFSSSANLGVTGGLAGTDQTFVALETATSQTGNILGDPKFLDPITNLHINTAVATPVESAGVTIAGITTDIDGDTRNASTPDIGADEGTFTPFVMNDVQATAFVNPANGAALGSSVSFSPSASFTNNGTANQTSVPVRYRILDASMTEVYNQTTTIATLNAGASATATFPSFPGLAPGSYSIKAKAELVGDTVSANDEITGTITVVPPLNGTYTVGSGGNFASLTNPGGIFDSVNSAGISGTVTVNVISDLTSETGVVALNENAGGWPVIIKPSGAARTISGTSATNIIKLSGADTVTIDGSTSGGTDRSLTIANLGAGAAIWIGTNATSGAQSDVVKNCNISGGGGNTAGSQGIIVGSGTTFGAAAEFPNSFNTIRNNSFKNVQNGIFISGNAVSADNLWTIRDNNFGSTIAAEKLSFRGIYLNNATNPTIELNTIAGISSATASTSTMSGIMIDGASGGAFIRRNRISDIKQTNTAGWGSNGIYLKSTLTASNITVDDNFIWDVASQGFNGALATDNGYGIMIDSGGGYQIWFNSVNMNTNQVSVSGIPAAINVAVGVTTANSLDIRNNIFSNTETVGTRYGIYSAAPNTVFAAINNNDYFAQNVGFLATTRATLANWQTATGKDANSVSVDPLFVSPTDLHLQNTSTLINAGATLPITIDIDGDARTSGAFPEIGADEVASPGTVQFNSATYSIGEGGGMATLTVTRTGGSSGAVTVNYSLAGGSATGGATCGGAVDYDNDGGSVMFADGDAADKTFMVPICDDASFEGDETFDATLAIGSGTATLGTPNPATVTITDNDVATSPAIAVDDLNYGNVVVGQTAQLNATIQNTGTANLLVGAVTVTGTNAGDFNVVTSPNGMTVTPGNAIQFPISFTPSAPGSRLATYTVASNAASGDNAGALSGTGINPGTIALSSATYSVDEGVGMATITVTRTGGTDGAVGVAYGTSPGTAAAGSGCDTGVDYATSVGLLSWANGDAVSKTFTIEICNDALFESTETVNVSISAPSGGATLGVPSTAVLDITENDAAPTLQFSSATYSNNDDLTNGLGRTEGLSPEVATMTVTRTGATENAVSVNFATSDGTATSGASCTAGVDYIPANGTLNFAAGATFRTFNVTVCSDDLFEGDETVNLSITAPSSPAVLGPIDTSVLTIVDNETVPTLQFSSSMYSNSDDLNSNSFVPGGAVITVTRTGATDNAVTVDYATSAGTATGGATCAAGIDYVSTNGTLSFAAGITSQTFAVPVCTDLLFEGFETVNLALSNPSAPATLGMPNSAVLTLTDNEMAPMVQFNMSSYLVIENSPTATITVTRLGATDNAVSVNYATSNGLATGGASCSAGVDYQNTSGTLNFASGETSKTFDVPICEDLLSEGDEPLNLTLSAPTMPAILGTPNMATLTINDNDGAPSLQFLMSMDSFSEGAGNATLTVTRSGATGNAVSVNYATSAINATSGASCTTGVDFIATTGTLNFASGETSKTFNVPICNDNLYENTEGFMALLSSPTGGAVLGSQSSDIVSITENDLPPSLQFGSSTYTLPEALSPEGSPVVGIDVTRTGATENAVSINYGVSIGTATGGASCTPGVDYITPMGTLNFPAGSLVQSFSVTICADSLFEGNELVTFNLSSPSPPAIPGMPNQATLTITDNDTVPPTFQFSSATYNNGDDLAGGRAHALAPEVAAITVTRTGAPDNAVSVNYAASNGTAIGGASCTAGVDYISTNGTLNFAAGVTMQSFNVTVCTDALFEGSETINLTLSSPSPPAILGAQSTAVLTVIDNETVPTLQFTSATYTSTDDIANGIKGSLAPEAVGTTITVTRTGAIDNAVSVNYATVAGGTATAGGACTAGVDYLSASGTLNFLAGETSKIFLVMACPDTLFEGNETVNLALTSPSAPAVLGTPNTAVLTILDNETVPTLQFSSPTYSAGEGAGAATITVTRTGAAGNAVSVNYATTAGGSATGGATCAAGVDYQTASGTLNFAAGDASKTFTVSICDDNLFESSETVNLAISSPGSPAVLGTQTTAVLTLTDNDVQPTVQFSSATYTIGEALTSVAPEGTIPAATIMVTRTGALGNQITVDYAAVVGGTATGGATCAAGVDYITPTGTLTFLAGETSKSFFVQTCVDATPEGDETVNLGLSNVTGGAVLGTPSSAVLTITDNDATSTISLSSSTYIEDESEILVVTVQRVGSGTASAQLTTSGGSATGGTCMGGADYVSTNTAVAFTGTQTTQTVNIPICGDLLKEGSETFNITLSSPVGATLVSPSSAVATIIEAATQFENTTPIAITDGAVTSSGIAVSGATGTISYMRVTVFDIADDRADDLNFVLVAPNGTTSFVLMADAGGNNPVAAGTTLTFNDNSPTFIPTTAFASGEYKPTSYSVLPSTFPAPAPPTATAEPGPGGSRTSYMNTTFGGMNANGTWMLYVYDDSGSLSPLAPGIIAGGWGIEMLGPTAAAISLSGRVVNSNGLPIRNAILTLQGGGLTQPMRIATGSMGYFSFEGLETGVYSLSVTAGRYTFSMPVRTINMSDDVKGADFVADPRE